MRARTVRLSVALAAVLAAAPARAQWRTTPIPVWLEGPGLDVVAGGFGAAGEGGLLVVDQGRRTATLRAHHAPRAPVASSFPIASLPLQRALRAGYLPPDGPDALADVASHYATAGLGTPPSRVEVVFGSAPAAVRSFTLPSRTETGGPAEGGPPYVVSFLRLLPRAPRSDTLVLPYCLDDICARLFVVDPVAVDSAAVLGLPAPDLEPMATQQPEAFPVWFSTTARALGLDDVAVGSFGTVVLWGHEGAAPEAPSLETLALSDPVVVGTTRHLPLGTPPPWLPVPAFNEVHGAGTLDVDLDGLPDLVFTMANPDYAALGELIWVKGTGTLADFADPTVATWHDLGAVLGLPDPVLVRPLRSSAGSPSIAVWDRSLQEIVVVTAVPAEGRLAVWRAAAPGAAALDVRAVDVVGSGAVDLVVVMSGGAGQPMSVLLYPDAGPPFPALAWAPGSPGVAARGAPHEVAVVADPGGAATLTVEWILGATTAAPVGTGLSHVFPADCSPSPAPLEVTARGTDDTGLVVELTTTVPVASLAPSLSLAGSPQGRLVLPPGGTTAVIDAVVAAGCGQASLGGTPWPVAAVVTDITGPTAIRRTVTLPEAAYPALLAEPAPVVSVSTTDPGIVPAQATLALTLDASGLVEVSVEADRAALAAGELAVLRIRVRSRLGVALPGVRLVGALDGLRAVGTPKATGATVAGAGADGAELTLDLLPPAGSEVVVEQAVRALGGPGAAGLEARSSGGWLVTAPAREAAPRAAPAPGCGCGPGSAPGVLGLVLAALALRRRARPPRPT